MLPQEHQQLQLQQQQRQSTTRHQQQAYHHTSLDPQSPYAHPNSSSSSSEKQYPPGVSPSLTGDDFGHLSDYSSLTSPFQSPYSPPAATATGTGNGKVSDESIGTPNHMLASTNSLDSTKATGYQFSLRRPGPPIRSHTTPNLNPVTPTLRQSASFTTGERPMEVTPPRAETGFGSGPNAKRYSDEAKDSKATMIRKKSGFSSLMSSMRGSPRRINISDPVNPIHVTHVGYDNQTGQFTVSFPSSLTLNQRDCNFPILDSYR